MIYSRTWVRNTVYLIAVVPTIWLYAEFIIGMKFLQAYQKAEAKGYWYEKPLKVVIIPIAVRFLFLDGLFDLTVGSLLFRKLAEWKIRGKTFTARLKMYKKDYEEMLENPILFEQEIVERYELAVKFCKLLNKIDPNHC